MHQPKSTVSPAPKYRPLTTAEISKIIDKLKDEVFSGAIDGEESAQILFHLVITRKF